MKHISKNVSILTFFSLFILETEMKGDTNSPSANATNKSEFSYQLHPKNSKQKYLAPSNPHDISSKKDVKILKPDAIFVTPFLPVQSLIHDKDQTFAFSILSSALGVFLNKNATDKIISKSIKNFQPLVFERFEIADLQGTKPYFVGGSLSQSSLLAFEGDRLEVYEFDINTTKIISHRSILWDLILPPRDRGGEAAQAEISKLRKLFSTSIANTNLPILWGIAPWEKNSDKSKNSNHLLALSHIKQFPFLEVTCDSGSRSACNINRQCRTQGFIPEPDDLRGIGVYEEKAVIADNSTNTLHIYSTPNCRLIKHIASYPIPKNFGNITSITVSAEGQVWIVTMDRNDIYNANILRFDHILNP